uniref:Uncharacterized protein n=1 Tax=Fibrocapsa japonica TaxID=94617 RepID=A0A7S2V2U4_9STRA|mmetsp:Transcript_4822/g.7235  ORF Transcript_4822/g.7235 Transcript_4822/m.7235 type:complete len:502 (+) Transcript_4822:108-1613(+)
MQHRGSKRLTGIGDRDYRDLLNNKDKGIWRDGAESMAATFNQVASQAPKWLASAREHFSGEIGAACSNLEIEEEETDAPPLLTLAARSRISEEAEIEQTRVRVWNNKKKALGYLSWLGAVQLNLKYLMAAFAVCLVVLLSVQCFFERTKLKGSIKNGHPVPAKGPFYMDAWRNSTGDIWADDWDEGPGPVVIVFNLGAGLSAAERTELGLLPAPLGLGDFERARSGRRAGDTSRLGKAVLKAGHGVGIKVLVVGTRSTAGLQCCGGQDQGQGAGCSFGDPRAQACGWPGRFAAWLTNTYAPAGTQITVHTQAADDEQMERLMLHLDEVPLTGDAAYQEGGSIFGGEWDSNDYDLVILDLSSCQMYAHQMNTQALATMETQVAGLASRALALPTHPAVLYLNAVQPYQNAHVESTQAQETFEDHLLNALEPLGVPVVSYFEAVKAHIQEDVHGYGKLLDEPYWGKSGDGWASVAAHQLMADLLAFTWVQEAESLYQNGESAP